MTNDLAVKNRPIHNPETMIPADFNPHRKLDSRAQAQAVLDETIEQSSKFIRIFDDRGEFYGFERCSFSEALSHFLTQDRQAQAIIVVHDIAHIEKYCPRVNRISRRFSPQLKIFLTDESIRGFARGMVIADHGVLMTRPHFGQSATFVDYDEKSVSNALGVFAEITQLSQLALSGTSTGL